jgi:two-component system sensor histidine kinase KdpD
VVALADQSSYCLSVTAHELRLPVSHIKGFVSTLRRRDVEWDEETRHEFLAQIERETDRLAQLIDDLLDASPRNAGGARRRRIHRRRATAPAALIEGGLDRVRGLLDGRLVELNVAPNLPLVEVDAPAIERVIANLVENAVKYASNDRHIRLSARATDNALELRVEDDGPGIPSRERAHVFDRGYRRRQAKASGRPGTGLGLAICLSIVSAHGGRIWADARPGGGTRMVVVLPLRASLDRG